MPVAPAIPADGGARVVARGRVRSKPLPPHPFLEQREELPSLITLLDRALVSIFPAIVRKEGLAVDEQLADGLAEFALVAE